MLNPIANPIADVMAAFYAVIPNFGVAILLLSVVWMILISPLTLKSTRSMLAMQALQPELKRLQEKHRNDKQAFAQAQMELFRERGVSPWGSCLPTILPLPVFFALYRVVDGLSHINKNGTPAPRYLSHNTAMYHAIVNAHGHINAFGLDLAKNAFSPHSSVFAAIPFFVLLLIMIGTQYYQTAMTMSRNPAAQQNSQMKMMKYIPIVFGFILIRFPAGVILYYAMSNLSRIAQQVLMYRYDPKVKTLVVQEVKEVEAKTREIDRADHDKGGSSAKSGPTARVPSTPGRSRLGELLANASGVADQNRSRTPRPATSNGSQSKASTNTKKNPSPGAPGSGGKSRTRARGAGGSNGRASARSGAKPTSNTSGSDRTEGRSSVAGNGRTAGAANGKAVGNGNGKAAANGRTGSAANGRTAGNGNGRAAGAGNGDGKAAANGKAAGASNGKSSATGNGRAPAAGNAVAAENSKDARSENPSTPVGAGAAARTGAGVGRNIPPRNARSKKRRGR